MIDRRVGQLADSRNDRTGPMEKKRIGRPSKGQRKRLQVRLPLELADALEYQAAKAGMTVNDYVGHMAAQMTGVPYQQQGALMAS